jgi:heptosyltransferase-2
MRIVVIRFSSLGDCILLCPLLAHLKAGGEREVVVVTKTAYAEVFAGAEGADRVVGFDPATGVAGLNRIARELGGRDTVVIDAHNNLRSRFLSWRLGGAAARFNKHYCARLGLIVFKRQTLLPTILEQYASLAPAAGLDTAPAPPGPGGLRVPDAARTRVDERGALPDGAIALAPGSRWPAKRWAVDNFVELATTLAEQGRHVVLVGDEHDGEFAVPIAQALGTACTDVTGAASVMETAAWVERCRAFVGNDSGLMHLAEALGVPVVGLFGPTVREFGYYPALERSRTVERSLPCRPCSRNGARPCPREHRVCMDIDAGTVGRALDTLLAGSGKRRIILE